MVFVYPCSFGTNESEPNLTRVRSIPKAHVAGLHSVPSNLSGSMTYALVVRKVIESSARKWDFSVPQANSRARLRQADDPHPPDRRSLPNIEGAVAWYVPLQAGFHGSTRKDLVSCSTD